MSIDSACCFGGTPFMRDKGELRNMKTYESLTKLHPCLSDSLGEYGRIHLPVCPACNLSCRYCSRTYDTESVRPGKSRGILPLNMVAETIDKALRLCPEITTVGIAGPGDTLASAHALEAFRIVDRAFPNLIKCMSTNGLLLPQKVEEIVQVHVDAVTVTVNAVTERIQAQINKKIWYRDKWIEGEEAAKILINNQLEGIRRLSEQGILVKINTVLIPGINDAHIGDIAKTVSAAGAKIYNIIPLIPQADMKDIPAPGCEMLHDARSAAEGSLKIFSHCQHCRADAVGRLGKEDIGSQIYGNLVFAKENFSHG